MTNEATTTPAKRRRALIWTGCVLFVLAVLTLAILAATSNWNRYRAPVAAFASARLHRKVTINGDLRVHLWSWRPSATVDQVSIANPAWATKSSLADIGRITVQIRLMALLTGHLDLRILEFDRPDVRLYRDGKGRATWDFSDGAKPNAPLRLPPIHRFIIDGGKLNIVDDQRNLSFSGEVDAHEQVGHKSQDFEIVGKGVLNGEPFSMQLTGAPLLNVDRNKPYPFSTQIQAGATSIVAKGAVPKPFDFSQFYVDLTSRGPDLADLYRLTGVPLPDTPPYNLHGRVSRDGNLWKVDNLAGSVGSSDLLGSLSIRKTDKRPFLTADLRSKSLNFPDIGALFGGARVTGALASPKQKLAARVMQAQERIFPIATLDFSRIRGMDADVTYKATTIANAPVNLRAAEVHVKLDAGLLRAEPLQLQLPQGKVSGFVQLNGRDADAVTDLDLRLENGRLENLMPLSFQGAPPFLGPVVGRARLHGVGDSVHDAMADANGEVLFVTTGGQIRQSVAELAGIDVVKGLGLLLNKSQATTPLKCGVLHLTAKGGVLSADRMTFDTDPMLIDGGGFINLDTETLGLTIHGHPKKFQLLRVMAPITVSGPILKPKVGIQKGRAIAQAGAALVLSSFLSPAAVLLPFVDAGLAKNPSCASLISGSGLQTPSQNRSQADPPHKSGR